MACNYDCSIDDWLEIRVSRDRFQRRVKSSQLNVFSNLFAVMWPPKQDEEFAVKYFFLKLKSTVMDTTIRLFRIGEKKNTPTSDAGTIVMNPFLSSVESRNGRDKNCCGTCSHRAFSSEGKRIPKLNSVVPCFQTHWCFDVVSSVTMALSC